MRKKTILFIALIGILLLFTGTVSLFVRSINGSIVGTTDQVILNVTGFNDEVNKTLTLGRIKPGDEGKFTLNINASGSGEDVMYSIDIIRTNLPDNLKFYYDEVHISPFANCSKLISHSASMFDSVTVYWYWDGEIITGNDNEFQNVDISAGIKINIEQQVYGVMKNGSSAKSEFWSDTYRPFIYSVSFNRNISEVPTNCNEENLCWDVSEIGSDYPVFAYLIDSGLDYVDNTSVTHDLYELYIVCDRQIYAPVDCSNLLSFYYLDKGYYYISVNSISFNDVFNTAQVTNMNNMFSNNQKLISLNLSSFNTSKVTSMRQMFSDCLSLTELNLSSFNTNSLTDVYNMFDSLSNLTSLDVSNFNTSKVTNMEALFSGCWGLSSLDIDNFNTSGVTNMSLMFNNCRKLSDFDLSKFITHNVTDMSSMFRGVYEIISLDLSNFNTSKVTNMSLMFTWCTGLSVLKLGNFNTSKVTNMSGMFDNCQVLTDLKLDFATNLVTDMSSMFNKCTSLINLDLNIFNVSNVTNMSKMFNGCTNLKTLNISNFVFNSTLKGTTSNYQSIFAGVGNSTNNCNVTITDSVSKTWASSLGSTNLSTYVRFV